MICVALQLAVFNYRTYTYKSGLKAFKFYLAVLSLDEITFCFIFIAVLFSSVNPSAFPGEVKLEQTTIKLIEAARYQLRCPRPLQHILHWPCRTLTRCYLSEFNLWPAATDPAAASLFLNGSDWNTHRTDYHAGERPLLWVRHEHNRIHLLLAGSFHFAALSPVILTHIWRYNRGLRLFLSC